MTEFRTGFRARRGRPPIPRAVTDRGTPELAAKRAIGATLEVIDIGHRHGWLTDNQVKMAIRFRWLYTLRFGVPTVQCTDMARGASSRSPAESDPGWHADRQHEYRKAAEMLESGGLLDSVLRGAVFNDPALLHPGRAEIRQLRLQFTEGLSALHKWWQC